MTKTIYSMNKQQDQPNFAGMVPSANSTTASAPSLATISQYDRSAECLDYLLTRTEVAHRVAREESLRLRQSLLNLEMQQIHAPAPPLPYPPMGMVAPAPTQYQAMMGPFPQYNGPPPYYGPSYAPAHPGHNYAPPGIILPMCLQPNAAVSAPVASVQPTLHSQVSEQATVSTKARSPRKDRQDFTSLWGRRYNQLIEFKEVHGHCNVPQRYAPNVELGRWVKDQRTFKTKGKLSEDRIELLEAIGFSWRLKCNESFWDEQLKNLVAYKKKHGNYNVSMSNSENVQLARWVDRQRRAKKSGKLTEMRMKQLESIGFSWSTR